MVKCPHCGSVSQVKVVGQIWGEKVAVRKYECGCGCCFGHYYDLNEAQSPCVFLKPKKEEDE